MKKLSVFAIALTLLASTHCLAQKTKEDVVERITGSWKFKHYWMPYDQVNYEHPKDTCEYLTTYTFNQDGTATIQSTDNSLCKVTYPALYWSVVSLHDVKGKQYFAIRLTEDKMPERDSYDKNTYNDIILMLVSCKKKWVSWVKKPQYNPADVRKQKVYDKI